MAYQAIIRAGRRIQMQYALLLALIASCGCIAKDGDAVTVTAAAWYVHGIVVTTEGAPVGGGTVELWRGSTRVAGGVMASHSFGFSPSQTAGVYQVRYTPPAGWECVDVLSAGVGWAYPGGCVGEIMLPEQAPSLGPDLVFVVAYVQEPTKTVTPYTPTAVFTPIPTATPSVFPTLPMPPVTPPLPTPQPLPTPPEGGWERWDQPDAALANALGYEVQWLFTEYSQPNDPLWLAASSAGPCWAIAAPMVTAYDVAAPDGGSVEIVVRWQPYLTPKGWRVVFADVRSPYTVAIAEGEGW